MDFRIEKWAEQPGSDNFGLDLLHVPLDLDAMEPMEHSVARGRGLVSNGKLGVDLITVAPGEGFVPHVHPGDHILIVVKGRGTITFDGAVYPVDAGDVYFVEGNVPHAVGAIDQHAILAVGAPHKPVDSEERMAPVGVETVLSHFDGTLTCFACKPTEVVQFPVLLHEHGCPHCPAVCCRSTGDDAEDMILRAELDKARDRAGFALR